MEAGWVAAPERFQTVALFQTVGWFQIAWHFLAVVILDGFPDLFGFQSWLVSTVEWFSADV
jgi:hypothetical protein